MEARVNPETGGEFMAASWLMEELGLAAGPSDIRLIAQVIKYAARDAHTHAGEAAKYLLGAAQHAVRRGESVTVFWFKDRKFAQSTPHRASDESYAAASEELAESERRAYVMWSGMSETYRRANPWNAPIPEAK